MKIEKSGTVVRVLELQRISETFQKQEVIIDIGTKDFPNEIPVTFTKDKTGMLTGIADGDKVSFSGYLDGRGWLKKGTEESNRKWFLSVNGSSIVVENPEYNESPDFNEKSSIAQPEDGSLPF